jgi:hypothetical protein
MNEQGIVIDKRCKLHCDHRTVSIVLIVGDIHMQVTDDLC